MTIFKTVSLAKMFVCFGTVELLSISAKDGQIDEPFKALERSFSPKLLKKINKMAEDVVPQNAC